MSDVLSAGEAALRGLPPAETSGPGTAVFPLPSKDVLNPRCQQQHSGCSFSIDLPPLIESLDLGTVITS